MARAEQSIRDRDAQHRRVPLDVEPIAKAQRPEFVLGELTRKETPRLIAELRDALIYERLIQLIVAVHAGNYRRVAAGL